MHVSGKRQTAMITALEIGCRLVRMATLLTLVAIFAAFQLGRLASDATRSRQGDMPGHETVA
jgi:hypothetical protein